MVGDVVALRTERADEPAVVAAAVSGPLELEAQGERWSIPAADVGAGLVQAPS